MHTQKTGLYLQSIANNNPVFQFETKFFLASSQFL
ncbi:hypothetical protein LRU_00274 [Ligilactobacillus ruminis SPM0211]|uniref:Uncharacterized protein n=1 Tax=Ligilactobacillus ruminis SPM0211 TaxID=1040964 RepID=F7QXY9_9LACO|nr:hypothetical protein LRU_00274 [Ligilactobacillus ruminis SPM0211]